MNYNTFLIQGWTVVVSFEHNDEAFESGRVVSCTKDGQNHHNITRELEDELIQFVTEVYCGKNPSLSNDQTAHVSACL